MKKNKLFKSPTGFLESTHFLDEKAIEKIKRTWEERYKSRQFVNELKWFILEIRYGIKFNLFIKN